MRPARFERRSPARWSFSLGRRVAGVALSLRFTGWSHGHWPGPRVELGRSTVDGARGILDVVSRFELWGPRSRWKRGAWRLAGTLLFSTFGPGFAALGLAASPRAWPFIVCGALLTIPWLFAVRSLLSWMRDVTFPPFLALGDADRLITMRLRPGMPVTTVRFEAVAEVTTTRSTDDFARWFRADDERAIPNAERSPFMHLRFNLKDQRSIVLVNDGYRADDVIMQLRHDVARALGLP